MICACNPCKCKCGAVHWFCNQSLEFKSKKKQGESKL